MKNKFWLLLCVIAGLLAAPFGAAAQNPEENLVLGLSRTFGYGGFDGKIQGAFKLKIKSDHDELDRVDFLIDDKVVNSTTKSPFEYSFNTADYPEGLHTFTATGYRSDGSEIYANEFTRTFLSSENANSELRDMVVPLIVGVGILTLLGTLGTVFFARRKKFTLGKYGVAGGAVCPRCRFPYARSVLAPNLLVGKLQVCPHCGKWAVVPAAAASELKNAEARLASEGSATVDVPSEEERLKKLLDDSRFER